MMMMNGGDHSREWCHAFLNRSSNDHCRPSAVTMGLLLLVTIVVDGAPRTKVDRSNLGCAGWTRLVVRTFVVVARTTTTTTWRPCGRDRPRTSAVDFWDRSSSRWVSSRVGWVEEQSHGPEFPSRKIPVRQCWWLLLLLQLVYHGRVMMMMMTIILSHSQFESSRPGHGATNEWEVPRFWVWEFDRSG